MRLVRQLVVALALIAGAVVAWALLVPASHPWLDRAGLSFVTRAIAPAPDQGQAGTPLSRSRIAKVVAAPPTPRPVRDVVTAIGTARGVRSAALVTEVSGRISELFARPGDHVDPGALIAVLDSEAAQVSLRKAQVLADDAANRLDRLKRLESTGSASELQLQDASVALESARLAQREAELELDRHRLVAPVAGSVGILSAEAGSFVAEGTEIGMIEDRSMLIVDFVLPERFASVVRVGDAVAAQPLAEPGQTIEGRIEAVDNRVDPETRTLRAQARLPNPDDRLRPGAAIRLELTFTGEAYPAVDPLAVQWGPQGPFVWVIRQGRAQELPVGIVRRGVDDVLVSGDFLPDDLIVSEGQVGLSPGAQVEVQAPPEVTGSADG